MAKAVTIKQEIDGVKHAIYPQTIPSQVVDPSTGKSMADLMTLNNSIFEVVGTLPSSGIISGKIYLVPTSSAGVYHQWIYNGTSWGDYGEITVEDKGDSIVLNLVILSKQITTVTSNVWTYDSARLPIFLEVGQQYNVSFSIDSVATSAFELRAVLDDTSYHVYGSLATITVGEVSVNAIYTPAEHSNFQWIGIRNSNKQARNCNIRITRSLSIKKMDFIQGFADMASYEYGYGTGGKGGNYVTDASSYITITKENGVFTITKLANASYYAKIYLPTSMMTVGKRYRISFDYTNTGNLAGGDITNDTQYSTDTYLGGISMQPTDETPLHFTTDFVFTQNAHILRIYASRMTIGQVLTISNFCVFPLNSILPLTERVLALEEYTDVLTQSNLIRKPYIGTPPDLSVKGFSMVKFSNTGSNQGVAGYDKYAFLFAHYAASVKVFDMSTNTVLQTVTLPTLSNPDTHANTATFGMQRYDPEDFFPLLYVCSGYPIEGTTTSQVYVFRITEASGVFTFTLVQTISLLGAGWTEFVCDNDRGTCWVVKGSNLKEFTMPLLSAGASVSIDLDNDTSLSDIQFPRQWWSGSKQGHLVYNQRLMWTSGTSLQRHFFVAFNLLTERFETISDLDHFNNAEPEGIIVWRGHIYVFFASGAYRMHFDQ